LSKDWSFIKRYAKADSLVPPPAPGEKRVVFMGNSITDAWINADPSFFLGKPYYDRGISGQTTGQMLVRFREDVINLKPAVVVILAGITTSPKTTALRDWRMYLATLFPWWNWRGQAI